MQNPEDGTFPVPIYQGYNIGLKIYRKKIEYLVIRYQARLKKKGCKKIYSLFLVFNPYVWYHTYSLICLSYAQLGLVAIRAASRVAE